MADVIVGRRVYTQIPMASSTRIIAPTRMYSIRFDIVKGLLLCLLFCQIYIFFKLSIYSSRYDYSGIWLMPPAEAHEKKGNDLGSPQTPAGGLPSPCYLSPRQGSPCSDVTFRATLLS